MRYRFSRLLLAVGLGVFLAPTLGAHFQAAPQTREGLGALKKIKPINAEEFRALLKANRGQIVLVNLWATWCIPCLKELPDLAKLNQKYKDQGLKVIAVSMDDEADLPLAIKLLAERGPGLTSYLQAEGDQEKFVGVIDPTWSDIMPTTFLLDREGKMAVKLLGGKTAAEFEAALAPLLAQGAK
jgi:thiol-disulfide isomerase/thioredoxin